MEVRDIDKIQGMLKESFVDHIRIFALGLALSRAYRENSREDIEKAAHDIRQYVDEGGDIDFEVPDGIEDYDGDHSIKMAQKYFVRVLHDRYCDDDEDQKYIATGLPKSMRQPVQLSLFDF